ncbi:MAG: transporter [Paenibacillus sp.]|jgi:ABC-type nitrate/sulfonate/bicarbonate transport system substrate-binding protein|nr:transporter [Paenibacillus sp.]
MVRKGLKFWVVASLVMMLVLTACGNTKTEKPTANGAVPANEGTKKESSKPSPILKMGYAKSVMSYPMTLLPETTKNLNLELSSFSSGNDVLTALVSKSIDAAQITYLHYITAMGKDLDIVPISGQVNGGTDILVQKSLELKEDDWEGLKKVIDDFKKQKKPFRVAASRGSAQDIQMRGEFLLHGIDPLKDIQIINIPNVTDHVSAIEKGEVEMATTVEPVASMAKLSGTAKHFTFPYNQAAGKLTNLIVTRSDVIKDRPQDLKELVGGVVTLLNKLDTDKKIWIDVVNKYTPLDEKTGTEALKNAYPDYKIHRKSALAIVTMMKELNYIQTDVSEKVGKNIDYSFLSQVTGKTKEELGYND